MAKTIQSELTHLSLETTAIFDSISLKSKSPLFRLENSNLNEKLQLVVWESIGSYIQRQLKMGKSVMIPKLGIFTFTYPDVNLRGTTNEFTRNKEPRRPVFLISKEFIKGLGLKSGVYTEYGLVPYSSKSQSGNIQQVNLNLAEIAAQASASKDDVKTSLQWFLREFITRVKNKQAVRMDIPYLGTLIIQNNIAGVKFLENVIENVKESATINIKSRGRPMLKPYFVLDDNISFYSASPKEGSKLLFVQEDASAYLKKELDIDVNTLARASSANYLRPRYTSQSTRVKNTSFFQNTLSQSISLSMSQSMRQKLDYSLYIKRIKYWMRNRKLTPQDAFYQLVQESHGVEPSDGAKLNFINFEKVLKKLEIKLVQIQAQYLFDYIDKKSDNFIDVDEWTEMFTEDFGPIKILDKIMKKRGLNVNELFSALGINRQQNFTDLKTLIEGVLKLEPEFRRDDVWDQFQNIFENKDCIEVDELVNMIDNYQNNERTSSMIVNTIRNKLKFKLKQLSKANDLSYEISNLSKENAKLSPTEFKKLLNRMNLRLTKAETHHLMQYYELPDQMIDCRRFFEELQSSSSSEHEVTFQRIAQELNKYLSTNKIDSQTLLRQLSSLSSSANISALETSTGGDPIKQTGPSKVSISLFSLFLKTKIISSSSLADLTFIVESIDIDKDGFIGKDDLEIFLQRKYLYKGGEKDRPYTAATFEKLPLYPSEVLNEGELQNVLRDLRHKLDRKRITNYEFFCMMDANEDGFLTIDELCSGIDQILPLPQKVKEGFFAYMDRYKIGIIDYHSLVKALHKNTYRQDVVIAEDNFDWPLEKIRQLKEYFSENGINAEDAFRMIDFDFDGIISKQDLRVFLTKILKAEGITEPRLQRLLKLLDQFKRGYIQLEDFKKVFDFAPSKGSNHRISVSASMSTRTNKNVEEEVFNWKESAIQQMGLVLSKKFTSIKSSYDSIAGSAQKITYKIFKKWIEDTHALHGFNLTENLLLQLFSALDPHKKGYLAFSDWESAFSSFNWNKQLIVELQNVLYSNFPNIQASYDYFLKKEKKDEESKTDEAVEEISYTAFKESIESLLPKRFFLYEIEYLWEKITEGAESLSFELFSKFLNANKFNKDDPKLWNVDPKRPQTSIFNSIFRQEITAKSLMSTTHGSPKGVYADNVFEKLKTYIRSGTNNLVELFRKVDRNKNGRITIMEFRNIIKKLNLGLTLIEIDQLVDFANVHTDGTLDWQSFVNRILLKKSEVRIFQRSQKKLDEIRTKIYSYMLTPKDAFARFNETGNGKMTYQEFNNFMETLCKMSGEEVPAFSIIKDIFDFIDIRKDGVIDLIEWTQTFTLLPIVDGNAEDTTTKAGLVMLSKKVVDCKLSDWENTKNYDEVMAAIGRNRKLIMNKFLNLEQRRVRITFDVAKTAIKEVLENCKVRIDDSKWPFLIKPAEKDGIVEFKVLMNIFRDRVYKVMNVPKTKTIYI